MKLHEVEALLFEAVTAAEKYFENIGKRTPQEALRDYARLKWANDSLIKSMKILHALQHRLQYGAMPKIMVDNNIRNWTDEELRVRFGMSSRWSAKIINKPMAYEWLRSEGHGALITETVNAQTLGSFAGNYIEESGQDLPDCFEVKQAKYATVTKVGKK